MTNPPGLEGYRKSIDHLDKALLCLLAERCRMGVWGVNRHKVWGELGHYNQGEALDLDRYFLEQLGGLLDEAANTPVAIPLESGQDFGSSLYTLDLTILLTLSERFRTVRRIGRIKRIYQVKPLDPDRWQTLLENRKIEAQELGLDPDWSARLFEAIHDYALALEGDLQH
ncbi:MAG: hypothetical protein A2527_05455 [Candidatus Lambdaproteobacteria bacterium RIFOXYD2_FULL_50_16]|uniref:chorismate mutase n=1 Tax=Candidatus Lambdaproteobacteria bacterium RIFOXYD2_FULL_50_16 TaxID=1817772 RepID=A0A1F6G950_9PROT|nr:MAG: hypothetical protein A2527_05455 [Candidatus Lambdaproteobacteria bacterium RIFOXYD2_FULL_50_16]